MGMIAPARTFGFEEDVDRLRRDGLALGGSLENAVIFGGDGIVGSEPLRFEDEPVRHKMLDLLGDLMLLGAWPYALVKAVRPGHRLIHELCVAARQVGARLTSHERDGEQAHHGHRDPAAGHLNEFLAHRLVGWRFAPLSV